MGSTVSILNETNCILNIALKQATPLYYENKVLPGQVVKRDVGKIWFTLEARLWNGLNEYGDFTEIVTPIATMSSSALSGLRGIAAKAGLVNELVEDSRVEQHVLLGKVILPVGATEGTQKIMSDWISDCVARERIFMKADIVIKITGGPPSFIDEGKEYQYIENTEAFTILH